MKHLREKLLLLITIIIIILGTSVNAVHSKHEIKNLSSIKNDLEILAQGGHDASSVPCTIEDTGIITDGMIHIFVWRSFLYSVSFYDQEVLFL